MAHTAHYAALVLLIALTIAQCFPQNNRRQYDDNIDTVPAATGHHGHHTGRVQIKVYRGQSKPHGHGWGHESFAPYGYWVRQPPDNHGHHHHY